MKKLLFAFFALFLITPLTVNAEDVAEEVAVYEPYVTTANLNLRALPTTESEKYETVPKGTVVWVTDFLEVLESEWYAVEHNGRAGFMCAEFLAPHIPLSGLADIDFEARYAETDELGTIELLSWSEAKGVFKTNTPAQIIDVRTKAVYWVESFSNGRHADVQPITADDTAAMKATFGNAWKWDPRPILVLINGRTLAASINGMPHGGSTNPNNNVGGHFCVHFKDSKTNNGNKNHERDHQNAVNEAFNTASNW